MPEYQFLRLELDASIGVANLVLNRPEVRNAFNVNMIAELEQCFQFLAEMPAESLRLVKISGSGSFFCAGGDLNWMRSMAGFSEAENYLDALALARMLASVEACPTPLLAVVSGGAFGGGLGLLCCCDHVIADKDALYSFSEVRLGIAPATILPYVLRRLGMPACQRLLLSGERFGADIAVQSGLVQELASAEDLEACAEQRCRQLLLAGPCAVRETKALLRQLTGPAADEETMELTAGLIARLRASAEGQEGLSAFLEKRRPSWQG